MDLWKITSKGHFKNLKTVNLNFSYTILRRISDTRIIDIIEPKSTTTAKVIHLKYYKHLKKAAQHSHLGRLEWAGFWQNSLYFK